MQEERNKNVYYSSANVYLSIQSYAPEVNRYYYKLFIQMHFCFFFFTGEREHERTNDQYLNDDLE